jgi:hypothetical protein
MKEVIVYIASNEGKNEDGRYFDFFKKNEYRFQFIEISDSKLPSEKEIAKKKIGAPTLIKLSSDNKITYHLYGEKTKGQFGFTPIQLNDSIANQYRRDFTKEISAPKKLDGPLLKAILSTKNAHQFEYFWENPKPNSGMENAKALSQKLMNIEIPISVKNTQEIREGVLKLHQDLLNDPKFDAAVNALLQKRGLDPNAIDMDKGHKPPRTYKQFAIDNILYSYTLTVFQSAYRKERENNTEMFLKDDVLNRTSKQCMRPPHLHDAQTMHENNLSFFATRLIRKISSDSNLFISSIKIAAGDRFFKLLQKEDVPNAIAKGIESVGTDPKFTQLFEQLKSPEFLKICDDLVKDQKKYNALNTNEKAFFNGIHTKLKSFAAEKTATTSAVQTQENQSTPTDSMVQTKIDPSFESPRRQRSHAITERSYSNQRSEEAAHKGPSSSPLPKSAEENIEAPARQRRANITQKPNNLDTSLKAQTALEKLNKEWTLLENLEVNSKNLPKFYDLLKKIAPFTSEFEDNRSYQDGIDKITDKVNNKIQAGISSLKTPITPEKTANEKQQSAQHQKVSHDESESLETSFEKNENVSMGMRKS